MQFQNEIKSPSINLGELQEKVLRWADNSGDISYEEFVFLSDVFYELSKQRLTDES